MGEAELEHVLARTAHPELGDYFACRELHRIASSLGRQVVHQQARDVDDLGCDPLGVAGCEGLHLNRDRVLGGIVINVDPAPPVVDQILERHLRIETGEIVRVVAPIHLPQRQPFLADSMTMSRLST